MFRIALTPENVKASHKKHGIKIEIKKYYGQNYEKYKESLKKIIKVYKKILTNGRMYSSLQLNVYTFNRRCL